MGASSWISILVLALVFGLLVANAVFLGSLSKSLSEGNSGLKISKGSVDAFLWIDSILAGIIGLALIYMIFMVFKSSKSKSVPETPSDIALGI